VTGGEPDIEARGLRRVFKRDHVAVDGLDLHVSPGEIYGFLGPNGAGKSTTVLMLTTLLEPTAGTARVAGFDIATHGPQIRAVVGAALQEVGLDPYLTGREHLRLQMMLHGIGRAERRRRADALLGRLGLEDAADWRVERYSAGMKRRLDLALALSHRPSILFLDEPTTGLDPHSRAAVWAEIVHLARDAGVTVFLTTQYLEEADALAERIGIIDHGRLVAEGTPAELKAGIGQPRAEVFVEDADRRQVVDALARLGRVIPSAARDAVAVRLRDAECALSDVAGALDAAGVRANRIEVHPPTLEDVFLETTGLSLEGQATGRETALARMHESGDAPR
jgi:ABC-2 type transport system ATP-binding protein